MSCPSVQFLLSVSLKMLKMEREFKSRIELLTKNLMKAFNCLAMQQRQWLSHIVIFLLRLPPRGVNPGSFGLCSFSFLAAVPLTTRLLRHAWISHSIINLASKLIDEEPCYWLVSNLSVHLGVPGLNPRFDLRMTFFVLPHHSKEKLHVGPGMHCSRHNFYKSQLLAVGLIISITQIA